VAGFRKKSVNQAAQFLKIILSEKIIIFRGSFIRIPPKYHAKNRLDYFIFFAFQSGSCQSARKKPVARF
jgi:hypothetical protein